MKKLKLISLILAVIMMVSMLPLAGMISAFAAEEEPEAKDDWYTKQTTDSTPYELEINSAEDLFAFAEKVNEGTMTKPSFITVDEETGEEIQMVVKLNTHIILNPGWNCLDVQTTEDVAALKAPAVTYPINAGAYFAGIFDGQGHVLSGLYVNVTGPYVGLFGNVPMGYTATVKNVIVRNSFIQNNDQAPGTIFGAIQDKPYSQDNADHAARWGKPTKGTVENVYIESIVSGTKSANGNLGSGGIVGGTRADLDVINCSFVGKVFGGIRGTGAVVGSARTIEMNTEIVTYDFANGKNHFYPNKLTVNVENCYLEAHLVAGPVTKPVTSQGGAGAIIGYVNDATSTIKSTDVVTNCTFGTKGYVETDGVKTEETKTSQSWADKDGFTTNKDAGLLVEEKAYYERVGYLYGFTHNAGKCGINNVPYDKTKPEEALTIFSWQTYDFTNTYYIKNSDKIKYQGAFYTINAETRFIINGKLMDMTYNATTGVSNAGLFEFTNWEAYQQKVAENKLDPNVKVPLLYTNQQEINYSGEVRMYNGEVQYAHSGEMKAQIILNYMNDRFALEKGADEDWATTLATKMTGLTAREWAEFGGYLLPLSVYNMVSAAKEAMDIVSENPTADEDWFENEINDSTPTQLVIYNVDDLLGFAATIASGEDFDGLTVVLLADMTLNEGWDAFAETVAAPKTAWPMAAGKCFAGTFDGQGNTISGIYLDTTGGSVGIFGNVATGTKGTVKNVSIVNSYVSSTGQGLGGIFGEVQNEITGASGTKPADKEYINKTKAIVTNVLLNVNVVNKNTSKNNSNLGTAAVVGGARADVTITNCYVTGKVNGGAYRGTSAFVGAIRPLEASYDNNGVVWKGQWFRTYLTVENCYAEVEITDTWGCVGGVVGYSNSVTTHNVKNVILNNTFASSGEDTCGYVLGLTWWAAPEQTAANLTSTSVSPSLNMDDRGYQFWNMENVFYMENGITVGTAIKEMCALGNAAAGVRLDNNADFKFTPDKEYTDEEAKGDASAKGLAPATMNEAYTALTALNTWADANGMAIPAKIFDTFYEGFVGQSISLGKDIALNVYVKTDGAQKEYEGFFAIGEDATEDDVIEVLSEDMGNGIHKFTLTGIAAYQMGDVIAFAFGEEENMQVCTTSVQDYLVNLMAVDAELASAVLRYGAAAQVIANYNTDALVTKDIELADEVDTTAGLTNDAAFDGDASTDYFVKGVALIVDKGVVKVQVKSFFKDISAQQGVSISVAGRTETVYLDYKNMTPVETENRTYTAVFANIDVASMDDAITFTILKNKGGNVLSQTLTTDMDDLIADFMASDASDADKALVKAMHAIGAALAE